MVKLRSFWVALAMGCAISLGTTSCGDDDEDEPQEQQNNQSATTSGTVMKDVVEKYKTNGSNLLDQATSMNKEELKGLADAVVEYNKNKNNSAWMETFKKTISSEEKEQNSAIDLLDKALEQISNVGVDMSEITSKDLLDVFNEYFEGKDSLGNGEADGMKQGATHQQLFNAIYEDKLAEIPATEEGLMQMMGVFNQLPANQKTELVNVALAWANKTDDEAWQNGFLAGVGLENPEYQQDLKAKLDLLAQYKSFLATMA